jgi:hypothetical protein
MTVTNLTENPSGALAGSVVYSTGGGGPVTGSVHAGKVLIANDCAACGTSLVKFSGTFSASLGGMNGTFTNPNDGGAGGGTWQLHRVGASSAIQGPTPDKMTRSRAGLGLGRD